MTCDQRQFIYPLILAINGPIMYQPMNFLEYFCISMDILTCQALLIFENPIAV